VEARLRGSRVVIIGVGALGSLLAEILVRGGVNDMLLVDSDKLATGNLARHRLRMDALGELKAESLADDLNLSSPHARVKPYSKALPLDMAKTRELFADRDVVIDCTAENEPLHVLSGCAWDGEKLFASVSVGRGARRLYFYADRGNRFSLESYAAMIGPWLEQEEQEAPENALPREGPGCWHPLFAARLDDLTLMAATALKLLEAEVCSTASRRGLQVFERQSGPDHVFEGLRRALPPEGSVGHG
jgi:hypothetical protein